MRMYLIEVFGHNKTNEPVIVKDSFGRELRVQIQADLGYDYVRTANGLVALYELKAEANKIGMRFDSPTMRHRASLAVGKWRIEGALMTPVNKPYSRWPDRRRSTDKVESEGTVRAALQGLEQTVIADPSPELSPGPDQAPTPLGPAAIVDAAITAAATAHGAKIGFAANDNGRGLLGTSDDLAIAVIDQALAMLLSKRSLVSVRTAQVTGADRLQIAHDGADPPEGLTAE